MVKITVGHWKEKNESSNMSRVEICSLAYEGKFKELKEKIDLKPSLATKLDENERMPIHWAASGGHTDIVRFLLDLGVPVDNKDDSHWTPLMIATSAGRDAIVSMLIGHGADINSSNEGGQTALHYAASRNRYEEKCFHKFLSQIADQVMPKIYRNVADVLWSITEELLQTGVHVNVQDRTIAGTPLHRAASRGHSKIVKLLLKHGARCDIQDAEGNTALHMACQEERAEIAVILVENGANPHIQNKGKVTPLDLANKGLARQLIQMRDEYD